MTDFPITDEYIEKLKNTHLDSYLSQREGRLRDALNEYLDESEFEALAVGIINHLRAEYQYCSERCGKIKRVLELLQTGSVQ
jgi:hypothetical protein